MGLLEPIGVGFIAVVASLCIILVLSILGYFVEYKSLGNKAYPSQMVEAYEDDAPNKISVEYNKMKWALVIYSFSITKNFNEIFFKEHKAIKDKNFEVMNGLRVVMLVWIIMGNCYLVGY